MLNFETAVLQTAQLRLLTVTNWLHDYAFILKLQTNLIVIGNALFKRCKD